MSEFYNEVMSHDKIYSLLYSPQRLPEPIGRQIIEIKTSELQWSADRQEFIYIWGYPGPDYNRYSRDTYGKGWAFSKEEIWEAWMNRTKGLAPQLCNAGSNAVHHHFFGCPVCGTEVGGFVITGSGDDDWSTHEDKFCKECGQKIDWSNAEFSSIYKY